MAGALFSSWLDPILAHSVSKRFGDFYGGMLHPISALEHLFPILALALLAGQQGKREARWTLFFFTITFFVGAVFAAGEGASDIVIWLNRASFLGFGALVAMEKRLRARILVVIALVFGFTHGYENTGDLPNSVAFHLFLPGLVATGVSLVAIGSASTVVLGRPWQKIAVRVVGSWITAIGMLVIGLQST